MAERAVSCNIDVVFITIIDKLGLRKKWVSFNLIDDLVSREKRCIYRLYLTYGSNTSGLGDAFHSVDSKVGYTNGADLGFWKSNHGFPGVNKRHCLIELYLIWDCGMDGFEGGTGGECRGPMDHWTEKG